MTNLAGLLDAAAHAFPDRHALVHTHGVVTYRDLDAEARQVARLLHDLGVRPGQNVALCAPNVPQFTAAYFGILKAGAAVVPLNTMLRAREIAYHLRDAEAVVLVAIGGTDGPAALDEAEAGVADLPTVTLLAVPDPARAPWRELPPTFGTVERDDDDTAVVLYTSGTTGQPKGAELRHRNLRDNALVSSQVYRARPDHPDTYLCALPLFHSFGQTCIQNGAVSQGGTVVLMERFDAVAALRAMVEHSITVFAGVPTMYWALLGAWPQAVSEGIDVAGIAGTLRVAASGGAALPLEIHREFEQRSGVTIQEGYGLSETSPSATFARFGERLRLGSIGRPVPGVDLKLIAPDWTELPDDGDTVGEIAIRGHNVMKGYFNRPEATAEVMRDGWFRSGDLARRDADGFYYIVDRSKDMIIRGGYNIYPRELEEVLMQHPAVSLVAVIGVPHPSRGEEIKAVVVRSAGHDDVSADDLVAWGRQQFAAYKYPRVVELVDALPMTSTGKIRKRDLS